MISEVLSLSHLLNDASIDRIMAIDRNWKIIAWNKSSELATGLTRNNIIGHALFGVFPPLAEDREILTAFENAFVGYTSFLPAKPAAFNRNAYENHFIPLIDDGKVLGVMNIMHDVSHRIKAERQLERLNQELKEKFRQLEKANAELATFTSITGNDLKEPIKKIYTSLELIMKNDGHKVSDGSKAAIRRMQGSLNRINLLLEDILALSSANRIMQEFNTIDATRIVNEVLKSMQRKIEEENAEITVANLPLIHGSTQMLHYLFYNLIDNALKFQSGDLQPLISITGEHLVKPGKNGNEEQPMNKISIADNGIGFDQAESARIFLLFEKLPMIKKYSGAGIGLALCQKIMEAHNGFIEVTSEPGKGSIFNCFFPAVL